MPPDASKRGPDAARKETQVRLGFQGPDDLFVCSPGDRSRLEADAMVWEYQYQGSQWKWCAKTLPRADFTASSMLRLKLRSDRGGDLFVKLEEDDKEAYFAIIPAGPEWSSVTLALDELAIDPSTRRNGRLDRNKLTTLIFADAAGTEAAKGRRSVWIKDLELR